MRKTAIVTGGSRGIGLAVAQQLGEDGCNIVLTASGPLQKYTENFKGMDRKALPYIYVQADITNSQDRQKCVDEAIRAFGDINILINNAGMAPKNRNDLLEMTEQSYDQVMSVNLKGMLFLTQLIAKHMIKKQTGTIVNISSLSSYVASVNRGEYCISKAGVSMVTQLYAQRLASEGVCVYEIRPGIITTDMTSGVREKYQTMIENGVFPIARWGEPQDVANAVSVLCSGKLSYTTGQVINVDGGFHIRSL